MDPARIKHSHYCLNGSICSTSLEKYHVPSGLKIKKCLQHLKYFNFCYIRKETYRQLGSFQSSQCRRRQHPEDTTTDCEVHKFLRVSSDGCQTTSTQSRLVTIFQFHLSWCPALSVQKKTSKITPNKQVTPFPLYLSTHPTFAIASLPIFLQIIYIYIS